MGSHAQTIRGWLTKVKSDSAKARWLSGSNKRYFTLNFETQTFYYGHDETNKKIANPIDFYDIMHAEQLPQVSEGRRSLKVLNTSQQMEYGFIVRTRDREIRLFSTSWKESRKWVDALNAAGSLGRSQKGLTGGLKVENSQSQASLSTNEGSGSGSSPPSDDGSDGAGPWQPVSTWEKPINGGYARAPWKPTPHGAPPIWAQVGQPHTGDSLPPWATGPEPGSKANENIEPSGEDAFAALDALANELGPVPEADVSPKKARKASKGIVRNARDIAALKNPELQVAAPPTAPSALPSFGALPSVAPLTRESQELENAGASTPIKNREDLAQQFSSMLGALPGPQQFLISDSPQKFVISDSPQKEEDNHSWDEPDAADKAAVADVIAFAEARGKGGVEDNDPWDSEPDEPGPKSKQRGPSEGLEVDHNSWDSEDEADTSVAKKRSKSVRKKNAQEDASMQDLDDLVGEVLDGAKRLPVHENLSDFRCTQCDNAVIRFPGCQWAPEVDYLFVRNFHGKPEKLRPRLKLSTGDAAYCCQCSWKTSPSSEALKEVGADLRWRVIS